MQPNQSNIKTISKSIPQKKKQQTDKPNKSNSNNKQRTRTIYILNFCDIPIFLAKKSAPYVIAAFLLAMSIAGPLAMKALALIAGKALIISKVALTIAGIIALKKIFSHDHHDRSLNSSPFEHLFQTDDVVESVAKADRKMNDPYRYHSARH